MFVCLLAWYTHTYTLQTHSTCTHHWDHYENIFVKIVRQKLIRLSASCQHTRTPNTVMIWVFLLKVIYYTYKVKQEYSPLSPIWFKWKTTIVCFIRFTCFFKEWITNKMSPINLYSCLNEMIWFWMWRRRHNHLK